jgi:hypothetical protein
MKLWVARDPDFTEKDGSKLNLFINKPIFDNEFNEWCQKIVFQLMRDYFLKLYMKIVLKKLKLI